jgi:hypothetical protein
MYCYQCGTQIADNAKFCSGCGRVTDAAEPAPFVKKRDMATHVQVLGWLFIGSSILTGMFGFALLIAPKILQNLPIPLPPDAPFDIVQFVSAISGIVGLTVLIVAAGAAAAGIGILQYQTWGRIAALIMAAVMLLKVPFGTAIGIYAFWVLLSQRGREHYETQSAIVEGRAG